MSETFPEPMPKPAAPDRSQLDGAQKLLDAALTHVNELGFQELSLRAIAQLLNTSHRMLIYYFGTAEGFWTALSVKMRNMQVHGLLALFRGAEPPSFEQAWAYLSAPEQRPYFRLMFQSYGRMLGDPERFKHSMTVLTDEWLSEVAAQLAAHFEMSSAEARTQARLRMAVVRGLMLDLLSSQDDEGVADAAALFSKAFPLP